MHDMQSCHEHNRRLGAPLRSGDYGIRISLADADPMRKLLGDDWEQHHWFETARERDRRLQALTDQFVYYRKGDKPQLVCEKVERERTSSGD